MGSIAQPRGWMAAVLTCLLLYGAVYVPSAEAFGVVGVAARAVTLLVRFVKQARRVDYWKLMANTIAFLSTAYDLASLYFHLTDVEKTVHTEEEFQGHLRTCKVCNELFCAMTRDTELSDRLPLFVSPSAPILTPEPKARFEHVWVDHNVVEEGRKGLRIHLRFHVEHAREVACRAIAYFSLSSGERLRDFDGTYRTSRGQVSTGRDLRPAYTSTAFDDFRLFLPYDELHMAPGSHDLRFQVAIFDKVGRRFLDRSDTYEFNVKKR